MNTVPDNDIFSAVFKEDFPAVKIFVEVRNVSVKSLNKNEETPAHIAAYKGNLPILKYLVNVDNSVLNITDGWGQTVLHIAVEKGTVEMVDFLVHDHEMDIYRRNKIFSGNTPIHLTALRGLLDVLKYFVKIRKIDPNMLNDLGQPPVFLAAQNSHLHVVKYLYEELKADVRIIDKENKTILHMCALKVDLQIPKYLLDEKMLNFDINQQDNLGYTIILWASRRKRMDFMKYFIEEKHADVNIQNNEGWSPLHHAVSLHNMELIKYLGEHGANLELQDKKGSTARNITIDPEVHELLDNLTKSSRHRRSVFQHGSTLYHHQMRMSEKDLFNPRMLEDCSKIPPKASTDTSSHLNNFLLLADAYFKYPTSSRNRRAHNKLLSSQEIVFGKMDPLAIDATISKNFG